MVQNPQGATCVIPKVIIDANKTTAKDIVSASAYIQTPKSPANYPLSKTASTQMFASSSRY
jgi:hypothetical protein